MMNDITKPGSWRVFMKPAMDERGWYIMEYETESDFECRHDYPDEVSAEAAYTKIIIDNRPRH